MLYDELRGLVLLDGFTDEQVAELVAVGEELHLEVGDRLFDEGRPADHWWLLLEGSIDLVRRIGHEESVQATMQVPGQWAGGFRAWDEHGVYMGSGRVVQPSRVFRVAAEELRTLTQSWFPFAVHLLTGLVGTARRIESNARQREALVALGTLAAGLAHEINNPASAAVRAVGALQESCDDLLDSLHRLAARSISAEQFVALDRLRRELGQAPAPAGVALASAEDELATWLSDHDVDRDWVIAPVLAAAGADVAWCERVASVVEGPALQAGFDWVSAAATTTTLIGEAQDSTRRISDLVSAVKSYSQLDRATVQRVQVTEGLESTVVMLGHRLGGITVERSYADDLPVVEGSPGELNQVWTNLIDNAVDAMGDAGTLRVRAYADEHGVVVEIGDTGHGLTEEVAAHAFEPFFTTKEVGKGTGLGLDISRRIVVERHGGEIELDSRPGDTVVRVRLPLPGGR
ncbi:sensor histidine kinase [Nocardioides caldifontis]|uniref:sensor histidine kinase n=1 Tax=Nocardioides caldifontis TaxID=2588938 RepID=UPI0011DF2EF5|nr:ATP-binding protein [Nocardioides caldifontis]